MEIPKRVCVCVCVCVCARVRVSVRACMRACVYVHTYVSLHPWVIVRNLFSLQKKIEAQLREVSHKLELSGVIPCSPPPPGMLRDAWTYFMHST